MFKGQKKSLIPRLIYSLLTLSGSGTAIAEWITLEEINSNSPVNKSNWVSLEVRNDSVQIGIKSDELPDFASFPSVEEKKQRFFAFLLPKIRKANERIRSERNTVKRLYASLTHTSDLSEEDLVSLNQLRSKYKIKAQSSIEDALRSLMLKIDEIPASLVLAQSANESGWGTSRFATQAKNMFGIWCFREGCGVKPLRREAGRKYEVAKYNTVEESVEAYMLNINSHRAYRELRNIRSTARATDNNLSGIALAEGLAGYSARGEQYVKEIKQLIRVNKLQRFNFNDKV